MQNKGLSLLIKLTEDLYKETRLPPVPSQGIDIDQFIGLASKNNLLFYVSKKMSDLPSLSDKDRERCRKIITDGEVDMIKVKSALEETKKHISNCLFFKTFRGTRFSRLPNDIDVLTRSFNEDIKRFKSLGYSIDAFLPREGSILLLRDDMWKIHLHRRISWARKEFFDPEFIYQNPREEIFNAQRIRVPNLTADVLIHLAHMNFEPLHIGLGELLYLFTIIPKINFDIALEQTKKYRWKRTFIRTLNLINNFHDYLYGELLTHGIPFNRLHLEKLTFPYCFSRYHLILSAFEKRLLIYPLSRIFKVFSILFSADSFDKYVLPSDRELEGPGVTVD